MTTPRVVFASDALANLRTELRSLGLTRPFLVSTPGRAHTLDELTVALAGSAAGAFSGAIEHVPAEAVNTAEEKLAGSRADSIVAIGGGSAIGLGKALALRRSIPLVAVPTTYSGSEMTSIYGITDGKKKATGRDKRVMPVLVLYDAGLTFGLPAEVSAASGMNALAHSVEALYASNATAESSEWALESISLLAENLRVVCANPSDSIAREGALRGAHLAGRALEATSMGLHHRICHVLGGTFGLPHAKTHAVILSYVAAFNSVAAADAMLQIARVLNVADAVTGIVTLSHSLPVPRSLAEMGLDLTSVESAAAEIAASNYSNPRNVSMDDVTRLLTAAYSGTQPQALRH